MTLICTESGETSEDGEGWKGELAVDLLDQEEPGARSRCVVVSVHRHHDLR